MQLVDRPHFAPMGCAICGSTTGLLDTTHELGLQQLRLYFCGVHVKEMAMSYGYLKGDEQDELIRVRDGKTALERDYQQAKADVRLALGELDRRDEEITDLKDALAHQIGRGDQLQAQLDKVRQDTIATLAATTGGNDGDPLD